MKRIGIGLIKLYRIVFAWLPASCRYEPTCSHYTEQAIMKYGTHGIGIFISGGTGGV